MSARRKQSRHAGRGQLRIIAGQWRSRVIDIADSDALRPTPDRVRETLFNWLQADVAGSEVLDLFAGTGVLALEALSRGAATATLVDNASAAVTAINKAVNNLQADSADVIQHDALHYLKQESTTAYDLVFLDPPYSMNVLPECCALLQQQHWLKKNARIYLECDSSLAHLQSCVPAEWQLLKSGKAGQVVYALFAGGE